MIVTTPTPYPGKSHMAAPSVVMLLSSQLHHQVVDFLSHSSQVALLTDALMSSCDS